ncbi:MAG TPA: glycoside hydrolase family 3 N-terminal domain-containing protein [Acidimicrobiales bacterium]|nr:glycoside hydrolase family 3 N-terminal domain-containing protein [Acidimicrobiales bacterium]
MPVDEANPQTVTPEVAAGAGGVLLLGSSAPADLRQRLVALARAASGGPPPLVMVDEEGGSVQRLAAIVGPVPSARAMAATMSAAAIEALAYRLGRRLAALGVTMDLAPVLDLDAGPGPSESDPDGTRSFGLDERRVAADGIAFARGLERAGVIPVAKHFPGLGGASGNTDFEPARTPPLAVLWRHGLVPFERAVAAGLPAVMVANATIPGLTSKPASLSVRAIAGLLRARLGFRGLVLTDSLSAVAVSSAGYSVPDAVVAAIRAGADMVLYNASQGDVARLTHASMAALVGAVRSKRLARDRLVSAAEDVLRAQGAACRDGAR